MKYLQVCINNKTIKHKLTFNFNMLIKAPNLSDIFRYTTKHFVYKFSQLLIVDLKVKNK